jgi:hypothetical protein
MVEHRDIYFNDEGEYWDAGEEPPTETRLALKTFLVGPGTDDLGQVMTFLARQGWGRELLDRSLEFGRL